VLLRTMFAPWRQIVSLPGRSIGERLRAVLDNLVSRCIGFSIRLMVLIIAVLLTMAVGLVGLVAAITWPFIPIAVIWSVYGALR